MIFICICGSQTIRLKRRSELCPHVQLDASISMTDVSNYGKRRSGYMKAQALQLTHYNVVHDWEDRLKLVFKAKVRQHVFELQYYIERKYYKVWRCLTHERLLPVAEDPAIDLHLMFGLLIDMTSTGNKPRSNLIFGKIDISKNILFSIEVYVKHGADVWTVQTA